MTHIIETGILRDLIETGRKALKADSNDAEHDALYQIVEALQTLLSKSKIKSRHPEPEGP